MELIKYRIEEEINAKGEKWFYVQEVYLNSITHTLGAFRTLAEAQHVLRQYKEGLNKRQHIRYYDE